MDFDRFENTPAAAAHPAEPAEADKLLTSEANVRNIGAGDAAESIVGKTVDPTADEKENPEEMRKLSSAETQLGPVSDSQVISSEPQHHDDADPFELLGHGESDSKIHKPEEKDLGGLLSMESDPLAASPTSAASYAHDSTPQNTESAMSSPREDAYGIHDENPDIHAVPADRTTGSPDRNNSPVIDNAYDSGVLEPSNPESKTESEFENYANEPTPKATEAPILDFPTASDIVNQPFSAPDLSPQEPGSGASSWNEDASPNAPNAPPGAPLLTPETVSDPFAEPNTTLPKAETPINLDPIHSDFSSPDPVLSTSSVNPIPSSTPSSSTISSDPSPSSYSAPGSFQAQPPLEPAMLGDHKLPGMPSTSSLDVEPPTPTHHSDDEEIEQHVEAAEEEGLRARGVQKAQEMVIPPAPDKPLPPTPGDEVKNLGSIAPAAGGKSCLSIGQMTMMEILLWRDPKKSGAALAVGLVVLLSLLYYSCISVLAYLSLALLTVTLGFRLYKTIMGAVQKTGDGHPFQDLLSIDTTVSEEKSQEMASKAVSQLNCCSSTLKDLFLVKDIFESVKFGFALYLLTYVGACFNTMTLVIMAYVAAFSLPKVYEMNKEQIDQVLAQVKDKMTEISAKVKAAIPMGKKAEVAAEVAEEKKEE